MKPPSRKNRKTYKAPTRRPRQGHRKHVSYSPGKRSRRTSDSSKWLIVAGIIIVLVIIIGSAGYLITKRRMDSPNQQSNVMTPTTVATEVSAQIPSDTVTPVVTKNSQSSNGETTPTPVAPREIPTPNIEELRTQMMQLVNLEREKAGLSMVKADKVAQKAGQKHADEMAELGYLSHWDIDGFGPDYRYSRVGGTDVVQENVSAYSYRFDNGTPAPVRNWDEVIKQVHDGLMNSEGHRANILNPDHTHLGIGIAYNQQTGDLRVSQEFINHYSNTDQLPLRAHPGDRLVLRGSLLSGATNPFAALAYEPFPEPMTLAQLNETGFYRSPAKKIRDLKINLADEKFVIEIILDRDAKSGLYHVLVFADTPSSQPTPIIDRIVEVR